MCGIIAALAQRNVTPILVEGLQRLEYRGYDSAGVAVVNGNDELKRVRVKGKVSGLRDVLTDLNLSGYIGIAHTRWATHGVPSERNAHPHISSRQLSIVHNGIIENYEELRDELKAAGYEFASETDTEVVGHLIHRYTSEMGSYIHGLRKAVARLEGTYAIVILNKEEPERLLAVRKGSPLLIGLGVQEYFLASDTTALIPVTQRFVVLEDGDIVDINLGGFVVEDETGKTVQREVFESEMSAQAVEKGKYKHFMLKEIFEQPTAVQATLEGRLVADGLRPGCIEGLTDELLAKVSNIHFVACGTSYHAAAVARYWIERYAGVPCTVEVASEYRYRDVQVLPNTLYVTLSQSGETADSLAALERAKTNPNVIATLVICNVAESSMVRMAHANLLTRAGPEIGVASTKAFTTQLAALLLLTIGLGKHKGLEAETIRAIVNELHQTPDVLRHVFELEERIKTLAGDFVEKQHAIFLGRGPFFPIALEGALKLKEISYIHCEGYPAGELKHGPLALVDSEMPVVAVAPNDHLLEKLKSNIEEVRTRGGRLYILAEETAAIQPGEGISVLQMPRCAEIVAPLAYCVPLQLLAYHVAVMRGTDVDQPRNLAKSVTVE
jgi:glucosamine--fructose-6-phosphate aminotransferase (isomerizing)